MKFRKEVQQSRMVAGVSVPISYDGHADYDELLREAVRVALRTDLSPPHDDFPGLRTRIRQLIDAYIESPEGRGEDAAIMMARLAACVADVIPVEMRKELITSMGAPSQSLV